MPVTRLHVSPHACRPEDLSEAVEWLRAGRVVIYPTDTFYGVAVDPSSPAAVGELFALKERSAVAAVPLVAASVGQVEKCCGELPSTARQLAQRFWPGPLS